MAFSPSAPAPQRAAARPASLTLVENRGQADRNAAYYARTGSATEWLAPSGIAFDVVHQKERLVFSQRFVGAGALLRLRARHRPAGHLQLPQGGLIFAFTSIAVINTLLMIALKRGRELALLRLVGGTPGHVRSMACLEAGVIIRDRPHLGLAIAATALLPLSTR